jgi:hypothetical protein
MCSLFLTEYNVVLTDCNIRLYIKLISLGVFYVWGGACNTMGEKRGAYRILVRRPEARRPLGRPRHRWEDNIKKAVQEVGWGYGLD